MLAVAIPIAILLAASTAVPIADGFDFPVGDAEGQGSYVDSATQKTHDGWYVATHFGDVYSHGIHPGEDWNGKGGGNTDLGQPVFVIGEGKVVEAGEFANPWGGMVIVEHRYKDGGKVATIRSVYVHLSRVDVKAGDVVARRAAIGAIGRDPGKTYPAHLHLELRTDFDLPPTYWPSSNGDDLAAIRKGYIDPSEFIRAHRPSPPVPAATSR